MSRRGENIYKRKDGRWEGRYIRDYRSDGSIHYGYVYAYTYKEVRKALLPLKLKEVSVKKSSALTIPTMTVWLKEWLHARKEELKPSTYATYQYKLQRYVLPFIVGKELTEFTEESVRSLITTWQEEYKLSASTIKSIFQVLQKALVAAFKKGYLLEDICENIVLPKKKNQRIHALSPKEQTQLEKTASKDTVGLPILIALRTGLRIGEISALTWDNIDIENRKLYVQNTYQRIPSSDEEGKKTSLLLGETKTASSQRCIPLSRKLVRTLKKWKKTSRSHYLFTSNNHPMEPRLLSYHFKRVAKKAALDHIHFHQLRHTFATRCIEAKADIVSVSTLLGHASAKTTLDIYVDSMFEQREKIIDNMEKLLAF
ncbi:MAG: tyrosine-type recombinase/integrase [Enterococcus sp.]